MNRIKTRWKRLLLLYAISLTLYSQALAASSQPQIIYLGSEVNEQQVYSTYLLDCAIDDDILIDVRFVAGGTYSTIAQCGYKITTPGTISVATLITASGDEIGPLTPVSVDQPPTPGGKRLWLPLVAR